MKKKISIKSTADIRSHQSPQIPDDISNRIDAWISGEKKNEQLTPISATKNEKIASEKDAMHEKSVRLNINIPAELHLSLKLLCLQKKMTITDFIKELLELNIKKQ